MGCQIYFQNPPQPIPDNRRIRRRGGGNPNNPNLFSSSSSLLSSSLLHTNHKTQKPNIFASSTHAVTQTTPLSKTDFEFNVKFQTLEGCKLGISRYPDFDYNAEGGTGTGTGTRIVNYGGDSDGQVSVDFDVGTLYIPPLTSGTTRFLGLPLPPFLKIDIVPQLFRGSINPVSGEVELEFRAKFWFSAGNIYKAPPLLVETVLTSEEAKGSIRRGRGTRLDGNSRCRQQTCWCGNCSARKRLVYEFIPQLAN